MSFLIGYLIFNFTKNTDGTDHTKKQKIDNGWKFLIYGSLIIVGIVLLGLLATGGDAWEVFAYSGYILMGIVHLGAILAEMIGG